MLLTANIYQHEYLSKRILMLTSNFKTRGLQTIC